MQIAKTILLRVIILPIAGLLCSQTALAVAHANNWYPELQLARLLMASPDIIQIEWVRWALLLSFTLMIWAIADYIFYRRRVALKPTEQTQTTLSRIRQKHASLVTDVSVFKADEKRNESTDMAKSGDHAEWERLRQLRRRQDNNANAVFMERFGPRIVDLMGEMQAAGASTEIVRIPMWVFNQWHDSTFQKIGAEILRLESDENK